MTPEAIHHLNNSDKVLARIIQQVGPCALVPQRRRTPYQALVHSVTHQQLNGNAARTILRRVLALYPNRRFPRPDEILATPDAKLRAAGLSRTKCASVKDIAAKTIAGIIPSRRNIEGLSDDDIRERLTVVRGIGPWTVEMLLMFTLSRPDVLPATDYGIRQGFALVYGLRELPTPREVLAHGEKWRPYRTTASWYLWRVLEL